MPWQNFLPPMRFALLFSSFLAIFAQKPMNAQTTGPEKQAAIYDLTMTSIDGEPIPLSTYKGKVLLIVNVASHCGHTPQYKDLETLYEMYKERGFVILGFPANNFGSQEPGADAEIKEFCTRNYAISFDMFSKISVKGKDQHPLYAYLTSEKSNPAFAGEVGWNFQKYLVDRKGNVVGKFVSRVGPLSSELTSAIEVALGK